MDKPHPTRGELLNYARPDVERPPRTRVRVQTNDAGVTFTDPPLTWRWLRRAAFSRLATISAIVMMFTVVLALLGWPKHILPWLAAIVGIKLFFGITRIRRLLHFPTVVQVNRDALSFRAATFRKVIVIPLSELSGIRASPPRRLGALIGRSGSLDISAWGRRFRLLVDRDYAETRWLARQLRIATGQGADQQDEPASHSAEDDVDYASDHEPAPDGAISDIPRKELLISKGRKGGWRQILWREYNQLGCLAGIFMFTSMVTGGIVTTQFVDALMICLEFGRDAYFKGGLRSIPHHGFFQLNNGRVIAAQYQALFFVSCSFGIVIWMSVTILVAIGAHRLSALVTRRRRGARR
jgi:hypothetical protein